MFSSLERVVRSQATLPAQITCYHVQNARNVPDLTSVTLTAACCVRKPVEDAIVLQTRGNVSAFHESRH